MLSRVILTLFTIILALLQVHGHIVAWHKGGYSQLFLTILIAMVI